MGCRRRFVQQKNERSSARCGRFWLAVASEISTAVHGRVPEDLYGTSSARPPLSVSASTKATAAGRRRGKSPKADRFKAHLRVDCVRPSASLGSMSDADGSLQRTESTRQMAALLQHSQTLFGEEQSASRSSLISYQSVYGGRRLSQTSAESIYAKAGPAEPAEYPGEAKYLPMTDSRPLRVSKEEAYQADAQPIYAEPHSQSRSISSQSSDTPSVLELSFRPESHPPLPPRRQISQPAVPSCSSSTSTSTSASTSRGCPSVELQTPVPPPKPFLARSAASPMRSRAHETALDTHLPFYTPIPFTNSKVQLLASSFGGVTHVPSQNASSAENRACSVGGRCTLSHSTPLLGRLHGPEIRGVLPTHWASPRPERSSSSANSASDATSTSRCIKFSRSSSGASTRNAKLEKILSDQSGNAAPVESLIIKNLVAAAQEESLQGAKEGRQMSFNAGSMYVSGVASGQLLPAEDDGLQMPPSWCRLETIDAQFSVYNPAKASSKIFKKCKLKIKDHLDFEQTLSATIMAAKLLARYDYLSVRSFVGGDWESAFFNVDGMKKVSEAAGGDTLCLAVIYPHKSKTKFKAVVQLPRNGKIRDLTWWELNPGYGTAFYHEAQQYVNRQLIKTTSCCC